MRSAEIQELVDAIEAERGRVQLYGSHPYEEHGVCFRVDGISATFSVVTQDGALPAGHYDIQIENWPPGDYIYTDVVTLGEFLALFDRMEGPMDDWPSKNEEAD